jgi:DNA repair exonuclease SbcCD ATPase subunit
MILYWQDNEIKPVLNRRAVNDPGGAENMEQPLSLESSRFLESIRAEIKKAGGELQKFLSLVESLREIIPDEAKRYEAASKALQESAGITRDAILAAAENQLSALGNQKKRIAQSVTAPDAVNNPLASKLEETRTRISEFKGALRKLQDEEKEILASLASEEKKGKTAEKGLDSLIRSIEEEIGEIRDKVLCYLIQGGSLSIVPESEPLENMHAAGEHTDAEPEADLISPMSVEPPADAKDAGVRPCPSCQNRMDWYEVDGKWKCFVCAHEED